MKGADGKKWKHVTTIVDAPNHAPSGCHRKTASRSFQHLLCVDPILLRHAQVWETRPS
jgi:hypothetical protein